MSEIAEIKIMLQIDFPSHTVRVWEGSGPYIDDNGDVWRGCTLDDSALDNIESAFNGEAVTLELSMNGVDPAVADIAYQNTQDDDVIGAQIVIQTQGVDHSNTPVGDPDVLFTGTIDNIRFLEASTDAGTLANITIECVNRFTLRTLQSGAVLSDADQRARAAILNPEAEPDRMCERIFELADKIISWPKWT